MRSESQAHISSRGDGGIMLKNVRTVRVQWGDCDPAGIVFYPRYFEWFDACTILLFEVATGMIKRKMLEKYGAAGMPLVQTRARFLMPCHYGEDVRIETTVSEFRRSSFDVQHRLFNGKDLAAEGFETRVWTGWKETEQGRQIKATPLPAGLIACFRAPEGQQT
jgi:4-hydroxybenzoyl-CoA thioesterase